MVSDTPQVVRTGRFEQILGARAFPLVKEYVVFCVAVGTHRAVLTAATASGLALHLHWQGDVRGIV